jgi:replicative DNA helicase
MGGIEPNVIYTFAGISGAGKSSFVNSLETDLFDCNPNEAFVVLSFNFEMLSSRQVGRKLSFRMRKTTSELYSGNIDGEHGRLRDEDFNMAKKHAEQISKYPIYYVDSPGTVSEIQDTIKQFQETIALNKWLLVILDHTLLTRGKSGDKEREVLYELQKVFMEAKKIGITTIIQVSQMNRDIETSERINNNRMHFPMRKDIFGSDSVFQASDYVVVLHRPELLGILEYGPSETLSKDKVFMHFLNKNETF